MNDMLAFHTKMHLATFHVTVSQQKRHFDIYLNARNILKKHLFRKRTTLQLIKCMLFTCQVFTLNVQRAFGVYQSISQGLKKP